MLNLFQHPDVQDLITKSGMTSNELIQHPDVRDLIIKSEIPDIHRTSLQELQKTAA